MDQCNYINNGGYSIWPGLTSSRVKKYLKQLEHTSMGYIKMILKGIQPTCQKYPKATEDPEQPPAPITEPIDNVHDIYVQCFKNPLYDERNTTRCDLPGRYPDTSFDGYKKNISCMIKSLTTLMQKF